MKNRRLGARRFLKKPNLGQAVTALKRLRLPSWSRKNRRRLLSRKPPPRTSATSSSDGAPSRSGRLLSLFAFLAPAVAALIAFTLPLIGVRAYEYVMQSGYFRVQSVVVSTTTAGGDLDPYLSQNKLLEIAGIAPDTHVIDADLDAMTKRLVDHPWIRWARIERELPDRLMVHVVEHRPSAYLTAGELYLVDELGVPFALAPADLTLPLPVISGLDRDRLEDPDAAPAVQRELAAALNVMRLWRAQGLWSRYPVSELRLLGGGRLAFVLESRTVGAATEIVLGRGPFREKFFRVEWVLEHLRSLGKTAEYVLLDLGDDLPDGAIEIGGARVVVKSELGPEGFEPDALPNDEPARSAPAPDIFADPPSQELDDPLDGATFAPLSGGRPARDDDEQE